MGLAVAELVIHFDAWAMLACLPIFITGREIARWEGGVLALLRRLHHLPDPDIAGA